MEVFITEAGSLPKGSVVSVRVGPTRRQGPAENLASHPLKFPTAVATCQESLKIDVLTLVASTRLVLQAGCENYSVPVDPLATKINLKVCSQQAVAPGDGAPENEQEAEEGSSRRDAAAAARDYLEKFGLLRFVQGLLHAVVSDRPEDPFAYMMSQLACAQRAAATGDQVAAAPAAAGEESEVATPAVPDAAKVPDAVACNLDAPPAAPSDGSRATPACEGAAEGPPEASTAPAPDAPAVDTSAVEAAVAGAEEPPPDADATAAEGAVVEGQGSEAAPPAGAEAPAPPIPDPTEPAPHAPMDKEAAPACAPAADLAAGLSPDKGPTTTHTGEGLPEAPAKEPTAATDGADVGAAPPTGDATPAPPLPVESPPANEASAVVPPVSEGEGREATIATDLAAEIKDADPPAALAPAADAPEAHTREIEPVVGEDVGGGAAPPVSEVAAMDVAVTADEATALAAEGAASADVPAAAAPAPDAAAGGGPAIEPEAPAVPAPGAEGGAPVTEPAQGSIPTGEAPPAVPPAVEEAGTDAPAESVKEPASSASKTQDTAPQAADDTGAASSGRHWRQGRWRSGGRWRGPGRCGHSAPERRRRCRVCGRGATQGWPFHGWGHAPPTAGGGSSQAGDIERKRGAGGGGSWRSCR